MTKVQSSIRDFVLATPETDRKERKNIDPVSVFRRISWRPWRHGDFKKQNWGNWLHRMSPYVGKMKPAMAHCLIESSSRVCDVVLDPFCGVGTVPLEADLMCRLGIGIDLNPYAATISMAKFDRHAIDENINWLKTVKLNIDEVDPRELPAVMKLYLHERTLKEVYALKKKILEEHKTFLLGCLLGILHGHRPGHLSVRTSLVVPFKPVDKPPYKEVVPRLIEKVERMYRNNFPLETSSFALLGDSRYLPLPSESVDAIVSSPPYYNTLDYIQDNRLRLEFLGHGIESRNRINETLIQEPKAYVQDMQRVGSELLRVLRPGAICVYVLGDCFKGKNQIRTGEKIADLYQKLGFLNHGIVEDALPSNPSFPTSFKRTKLDRIIVMQKPQA